MHYHTAAGAAEFNGENDGGGGGMGVKVVLVAIVG